MPINYTVAQNGALVIEKWDGVISHQELINHQKQHQKDDSIKRGASVLAYCLGATFETLLSEVHEVADAQAVVENKAKISRYALVVKHDLLERVQRFSAQVSKRGSSTIAFVTLDTACSWLGVDAKEMKRILDELSGD